MRRPPLGSSPSLTIHSTLCDIDSKLSTEGMRSGRPASKATNRTSSRAVPPAAGAPGHRIRSRRLRLRDAGAGVPSHRGNSCARTDRGRLGRRHVAVAAGSQAATQEGRCVNDAPALPRRSSLGYQVNHLARLLAQALRARIAPHGVVPGQFAQLLALYEQDGQSQKELCERVRVEQPTMANTLRRMERDGLIRRLPDPSDGRRAVVMLTERARGLENALVDGARSVNSEATRGISDDEMAAFMATMSRIIRNLEATPADRQAFS